MQMHFSETNFIEKNALIRATTLYYFILFFSLLNGKLFQAPRNPKYVYSVYYWDLFH